MKTAVEAVFIGKDRLFNRRFQQMCGHYLVEPVACTPGAGWEKGQVENQVGTIRGRLFTPRLRFRSYDELNAWLLDQCVAYARRHRHPVFRDRTIWQVFEDERPSLVGYRGPFDGFHAVPAAVSKTCLVRFDANKYSVAARAVGRPVEIHAYADRIVIRQDGEIVAEHARRYGRDQTFYDPCLRGAAIALSVRGPVRPARQGQRQGQGRGADRLHPAQLPGAGAAGREHRCPERWSRGAVPPAPGGAAAGPQGDDRRAPRAGSDALLVLPPAPYDACDRRPGRVSSLSLVRYRNNDYSVPVAYGHREVLIRGYVDEVVISCAADVIARHRRSYDSADLIFDPRHYLALIEQKIGALDQAAPLAGWQLPEVFATLRRLLEARMGKAGKREYVQVLRLLETFRLTDVAGAIQDALRLGAVGFDAVKHLVLCRIERRPPRLNLDGYPYLPKATVATTSAGSYMSLLSGAGA